MLLYNSDYRKDVRKHFKNQLERVQQRRYGVRFSNACACVRGTRYLAVSRNGIDRIYVSEGQVEFTLNVGGKVVVKAGQKITIRRGVKRPALEAMTEDEFKRQLDSLYSGRLE